MMEELILMGFLASSSGCSTDTHPGEQRYMSGTGSPSIHDGVPASQNVAILHLACFSDSCIFPSELLWRCSCARGGRLYPMHHWAKTTLLLMSHLPQNRSVVVTLPKDPVLKGRKSFSKPKSPTVPVSSAPSLWSLCLNSWFTVFLRF